MEKTPSEDSRALTDLLERLALEEIDADVYRGQNVPSRPGRLFGGQVAGQALVAACRTVEPGLRAHSLHGYFLRPGDPKHPVLYTVDRIRDGRSFTTRRVVALQRGRAIFNTAISFQIEEAGYEHQMPMPTDAPDPESIPTTQERMAKLGKKLPEMMRKFMEAPNPIDMRHSQLPTFLGGGRSEGPNHAWFRVCEKIGDDPLEHQALLTYITDMSLLDNVVRPHGREGDRGPLMMASLDHAIWFHRPVRVDEWLLYATDSPVANGARGFARGTIYTREGVLVASVAQEGLMRPVGEPEDRSL